MPRLLIIGIKSFKCQFLTTHNTFDIDQLRSKQKLELGFSLNPDSDNSDKLQMLNLNYS